MRFKDELTPPWSYSKTVDPEELIRFSQLAQEWWDPDGRFKPIHRFNPIRLDYIINAIAQHYCIDTDSISPFKQISVLDVGCGAGLLCEPIAAMGAAVTGIDAVARNIEVAKWHSHLGGYHINYRHCLAEELLKSGNTFDVIINTEVLEHVSDAEQLVKECSELISPGGMMIAATINRTVRSFFIAIIGAEYILNWLPKGTHNWRRFISPDELEIMMKMNGLTRKDLSGVVINPFTRAWHLSSNVSINYLLTVTKSV